MKNSYSCAYLERKFGSPAAARQWENKRRREMSEYFGVPFSKHFAHGRVIFLPKLTVTKTEPIRDERFDALFGAAYLEAKRDAGDLFGYVTLWKLNDYFRWGTGQKIGMKTLVGVATAYVLDGRAVPTVNRAGDPVAIRIILS